ncbi:universal stress protein [Stappia sp. GBMRC 2046]|uniref:Universal stress protein n=1 Tax=Stappia sediminis TaxID=2692190 RepID=A0A7X3LS09_9HYPH|nr:universal stress protein [Stappia sediminis]MXN64024.1 universal stress protein [Stappia sediminis]
MDMNLVLVATDGSEAAGKAFEFAVDMAKSHAARLIVLHVQKRHGSDILPAGLEEASFSMNVLGSEAEMYKIAARRLVSESAQHARGEGVIDVEELVVEGDPSRLIVEVANSRSVDVIVVGSRGREGLEGLMLGSVSHKVAHAAPCTCIIVR